MQIPRHIRTFSIAAVIALGLLAVMLAAHGMVERKAMQGEQAQARRQLDLYAQALQQRIDRYRTLPRIMALDPDLREALVVPLDAARRDAVNRKLQRANGITESSTLTLIGHDGIAIAASNWQEAATNVGRDYAFRPYLRQALDSGQGHFYGIGVTTGEPGYFLSQAIRADDGRVLGAIVIKIELSELEREWLRAPDIVLVSDGHGVVFLSSRDAWRYRALQPLAASEQRELHATRQYANEPLAPVRMEALPPTGGDVRLVRVDEPRLPHPMLWQTTSLEEIGWKLHLLHDVGSVRAAARTAALAAGGAWLAIAFLVLLIAQRRRLTRYRQRSREELEAVLRQHAEELRTAQDSLVQAATDAGGGLSRSLEHLPQGVVIIDAGLNLVAWNSRYAELFRFPQELLQVGRPIEDLFRHNARRGLLGAGPVDEAIERRLGHLRSGRPHLRESEKEDGTVLEIRGNPLPDGGFVTSYADITSYKNAARELRSLADALEHRVEERTHALASAKAEAERANRYKTRFVAAAVHDLLQPLNAARMFLSVLRTRPGDAEERAIAGHADNALSAQESILNSLLDISRLESGSLPTHVHDFRLDPLLEALDHEFGIIARERGLVLERVPTRAIVRSDKALLRRILQNLLSNAVRYTREGRVVIGCRRDGDFLRIEVHDQGPGIPERLHGEIFEEFRRFDDGGANDRGTGLGLAIVERIGRLLGHPVGLRSRLGHGSVFHVRVPLADAESQPPSDSSAMVATSPESELEGCRVWCIDDDPHACAAIRALLERWGCEVQVATQAAQALSAAASGEAPDLVLLDIHLANDSDAFGLYPLLCARWNGEPPAILVTAGRDEDLRARAQDHGWGFLTKPVRPPALRALMSQLLLRGAA